jgi:hypothetical protein
MTRIKFVPLVRSESIERIPTARLVRLVLQHACIRQQVSKESDPGKMQFSPVNMTVSSTKEKFRLKDLLQLCNFQQRNLVTFNIVGVISIALLLIFVVTQLTDRPKNDAG